MQTATCNFRCSAALRAHTQHTFTNCAQIILMQHRSQECSRYVKRALSSVQLCGSCIKVVLDIPWEVLVPHANYPLLQISFLLRILSNSNPTARIHNNKLQNKFENKMKQQPLQCQARVVIFSSVYSSLNPTTAGFDHRHLLRSRRWETGTSMKQSRD